MKERSVDVLLDPAELAERAALAQDIAEIRQALKDSRMGRGRDAMQALRDIADKIGVKLDR